LNFIISREQERIEKERKKGEDCEVFGREKMNEENNQGQRWDVRGINLSL